MQIKKEYTSSWLSWSLTWSDLIFIRQGGWVLVTNKWNKKPGIIGGVFFCFVFKKHRAGKPHRLSRKKKMYYKNKLIPNYFVLLKNKSAEICKNQTINGMKHSSCFTWKCWHTSSQSINKQVKIQWGKNWFVFGLGFCPLPSGLGKPPLVGEGMVLIGARRTI